jgi:sugar-specific transcriptional regulator TrmB
MRSQFSLQPLVELGLTALESEIYAYLLENSPATGYRIAKSIAKPTANTYKAIESLQDKGAILIEDSKSRLCRAVPREEFLQGLERRFFQLKSEAKRELAKLKPAPDDERIYTLRTPDQVFERLRQMLQMCQQIALLDLFPLALDKIRDDIKIAASRGIRIAVKVYQPCKIPGVEVVLAQHGDRTLQRWPGLWANLIIDGEEHLLAFFSKDAKRILQAVWSANTYTSWVYHSSLMFELQHGVLAQQFTEMHQAPPLPEKYRRLQAMKAEQAPGYQKLLERFSEKEDEK